MHVLFISGDQTKPIIEKELNSITEFTYDIISIGEIAAFLTPSTLKSILSSNKTITYDLVVISGMCSASFDKIEQEYNIPIRKGTRHAADIQLCIPMILNNKLSATIPADELCHCEISNHAISKLKELEEKSVPAFNIHGIKIGGTSRIKIVYEIMDAHKDPNIRDTVITAINDGADIIDLGFGFDATPDDVKRSFSLVEDLDIPLSIDTLNPELIKAALFRCDLIISLTLDTLIPIADLIRNTDISIVIIPNSNNSLENTIINAQKYGLSKIIVDPLLKPPLSGMIDSIHEFSKDYSGLPKLFGCVNVIEMIDADSPGICAILAAIATECNVSLVLISTHSDKTQGVISEMKRSIDMMTLSKGRPYPKDVGIDVFCIKEKRKRREPKLQYTSIKDANIAPNNIKEYDKCGNFRIGIENGYIIAIRNGYAIRGTNWYDVFSTILEGEGVSLLDHAAYLGKELYKAELALKFNRSFEQDGNF